MHASRAASTHARHARYLHQSRCRAPSSVLTDRPAQLAGSTRCSMAAWGMHVLFMRLNPAPAPCKPAATRARKRTHARACTRAMHQEKDPAAHLIGWQGWPVALAVVDQRDERCGERRRSGACRSAGLLSAALPCLAALSLLTRGLRVRRRARVYVRKCARAPLWCARTHASTQAQQVRKRTLARCSSGGSPCSSWQRTSRPGHPAWWHRCHAPRRTWLAPFPLKMPPPTAPLHG